MLISNILDRDLTTTEEKIYWIEVLELLACNKKNAKPLEDLATKYAGMATAKGYHNITNLIYAWFILGDTNGPTSYIN